jgi:hypothetical protein
VADFIHRKTCHVAVNHVARKVVGLDSCYITNEDAVLFLQVLEAKDDVSIVQGAFSVSLRKRLKFV